MQKTAVWKRLLSFAMMVCMVATSVLPNFVYAAEAESPPLPSSEIQIEASTTGTEVVPGNVNGYFWGRFLFVQGSEGYPCLMLTNQK